MEWITPKACFGICRYSIEPRSWQGDKAGDSRRFRRAENEWEPGLSVRINKLFPFAPAAARSGHYNVRPIGQMDPYPARIL